MAGWTQLGTFVTGISRIGDGVSALILSPRHERVMVSGETREVALVTPDNLAAGIIHDQPAKVMPEAELRAERPRARGQLTEI